MFKIPRSQAENPNPGGDWIPDEGLWAGVIEEVRIQEVRIDEEGGPVFVLRGAGGEVVNREAEVASIQIGDLQPLDGQDPAGNRKIFDDLIMLSADGREWIDDPVEGENWRLNQARRRLTNLALALDLVEEDGDFVYPSPDFVESLQDGGLKGEEVEFEIRHRTFKRRDGSEGVAAEIVRYVT